MSRPRTAKGETDKALTKASWKENQAPQRARKPPKDPDLLFNDSQIATFQTLLPTLIPRCSFSAIVSISGCGAATPRRVSIEPLEQSLTLTVKAPSFHG